MVDTGPMKQRRTELIRQMLFARKSLIIKGLGLLFVVAIIVVCVWILRTDSYKSALAFIGGVIITLCMCVMFFVAYKKSRTTKTEPLASKDELAEDKRERPVPSVALL